MDYFMYENALLHFMEPAFCVYYSACDGIPTLGEAQQEAVDAVDPLDFSNSDIGSIGQPRGAPIALTPAREPQPPSEETLLALGTVSTTTPSDSFGSGYIAVTESYPMATAPSIVQARPWTDAPFSVESTPHSQHAQSLATAYSATSYGIPTQDSQMVPSFGSRHSQHRHHCLLSQSSRSKSDHGRPSVLGRADMPAPAQYPLQPKRLFTPKSDALLIQLKERKDLTWKQIADFFPGRKPRTLQVRYCVKLKIESQAWTNETTQKLRKVLQEYDDWHIISREVGNGFSAAACERKAAGLAHTDRACRREEQSNATSVTDT